MKYFWYFIGAIFAISLAVTYWPIALIAIGTYVAVRVIRVVRKNKYFASEEFQARKEEIKSVISEHNEISDYVGEIRANGTFSIGESSTGVNAHLASSANISRHNYKRDRNVADLGAKNIHNASLQVVRNASIEPIKYLIKYFGIESTEEKLAEVEALGESISRLENAVRNLEEREAGISNAIAPPKFIIKHYLREFQDQIGLSISKLQVPYPNYVFQYLSAGGNSGQKTEINLNTQTIDALITELSTRIKFRKSAAGQRALMTAKLRDFVKSRDSYTCKYCTISVANEPHLLLEVDHITPVSKGGLSVEENLQTLCWKCNRTKSNKIIA